MRSLSPQLLQAQRQPSARPHFRVQAVDQLATVPRPHWERLYTGSEADSFNAACVTDTGSLVRAYNDGGTLRVMTTLSPGPGADFATWTNLGACAAGSGVALASSGSTVLLVFVAADGVTITEYTSTDSGLSWNVPSTVIVASSGVGWLALAVTFSGVYTLLWNQGADVRRIKRTAGVWGAAALWTLTVGTIDGLAIVWRDDYYVLVAGTDTAGRPTLWGTALGDGFLFTLDAWLSLTVIEQAGAGSGVGFRAPSATWADFSRMWFTETFSGSVAYATPKWSQQPVQQGWGLHMWREGVPLNVSNNNGVASTATSDYLWATTAYGVWRSPRTPPVVDLTPDVISLSFEQSEFAGRCRLVLSNPDGRYPGAAFRLGTELQLQPGMLTTTGPAVSAGLTVYVESWALAYAAGRPTVTIEAHDAWGELARWRARRSFAWPAGSRNTGQVLAEIFARAGFNLRATSFSATFTAYTPGFTVQPGEDGLSAVRRLLATVPDRVHVEGSDGVIVNPQASDPSVYAYAGPGGPPGVHPVVQAVYRVSAPAATAAAVHGAGVTAVAFDQPDAEDAGARWSAIIDKNVAVAADATARAALALRRAQLAEDTGALVVLPNCGQSLWDVIDITDPRVPLTAALARVRSLVWTFHQDRGAFSLDIGLTNP